jgi:hypothetical protein
VLPEAGNLARWSGVTELARPSDNSTAMYLFDLEDTMVRLPVVYHNREGARVSSDATASVTAGLFGLDGFSLLGAADVRR